MVGPVRTSRLAAVAAARASPFTPSSFRRAGSAERIARTSAAAAFSRWASSSGNALWPGAQGPPVPPGDLPSEGGSSRTGAGGMAPSCPTAATPLTVGEHGALRPVDGR